MPAWTVTLEKDIPVILSIYIDMWVSLERLKVACVQLYITVD